MKCKNIKDLWPTVLNPNSVLSNSEIGSDVGTERSQLYYFHSRSHSEMLAIGGVLPAHATSEGEDSCMNALKVIHGFALISGPRNVFVRGLAPLFTSELSTSIKEVAGKQEHSCRHEEYELPSRRISKYIPYLYPVRKKKIKVTCIGKLMFSCGY